MRGCSDQVHRIGHRGDLTRVGVQGTPKSLPPSREGGESYVCRLSMSWHTTASLPRRRLSRASRRAATSDRRNRRRSARVRSVSAMWASSSSVTRSQGVAPPRCRSRMSLTRTCTGPVAEALSWTPVCVRRGRVPWRGCRSGPSSTTGGALRGSCPGTASGILVPRTRAPVPVRGR